MKVILTIVICIVGLALSWAAFFILPGLLIELDNLLEKPKKKLKKYFSKLNRYGLYYFPSLFVYRRMYFYLLCEKNIKAHCDTDNPYTNDCIEMLMHEIIYRTEFTEDSKPNFKKYNKDEYSDFAFKYIIDAFYNLITTQTFNDSERKRPIHFYDELIPVFKTVRNKFLNYMVITHKLTQQEREQEDNRLAEAVES